MTESSTTQTVIHPYRVRAQTSGYNGVPKYIVVKLRKGDRPSRVSVHPHVTREAAQAAADDLNICEMVRPHADDPRPYAVRRVEAEAEYRASAGL